MLSLAFLGTFALGYAFKSSQQNPYQPMKKVTGIGGIFFKCQDPTKIKSWYQQHLGLNITDYGVQFEWNQEGDTSKKGSTTWAPFSAKSDYFAPSNKEFMINYRVDNLVALVEELKKEGVPLLDEIAVYDYGKFIHLMDPEGNKIELWEPLNE
jgi:predicted enzyme related to lactoylglutathione lyase